MATDSMNESNRFIPNYEQTLERQFVIDSKRVSTESFKLFAKEIDAFVYVASVASSHEYGSDNHYETKPTSQTKRYCANRHKGESNCYSCYSWKKKPESYQTIVSLRFFIRRILFLYFVSRLNVVYNFIQRTILINRWLLLCALQCSILSLFCRLSTRSHYINIHHHRNAQVYRQLWKKNYNAATILQRKKKRTRLHNNKMHKNRAFVYYWQHLSTK